MSLFQDRARTDSSPHRHDESVFDFLDRVDGPSWSVLRRTLNDWVDDCATEHKARMVPMFKASLSSQFYDAFWELYLHRVFRCLGLAVSYEVSGPNARAPDYLIDNGQQTVQLEATVLHDSSEDQLFDRRIAPVYELISKLDSPNFFIQVLDATAGQLTPPLRELGADLRQWVSLLDPDEVYPRGALDFWPRRQWRWRDWRFEFGAVPKKPSSRGKPMTSLGSTAIRGGMVDDSLALREKMRQKAKHYRPEGAPLIIAICSTRLTTVQHEFDRALFGSAFEHHADLGNGRLPVWARGDEHSGLWLDQSGPRYRRVSAVIAVANLVPWAMGGVMPSVYHNPWAFLPVEIPMPFSAVRVDVRDGLLETTPPVSTPLAMLRLDAGWPGGAWWPREAPQE